eukprot:g1821.t1
MSMRTSSVPWTSAVEKWLALLMKKVEPWLASQGGPIVLAQIENELNSALPGPGDTYVDWCGKLVRKWPSPVWTMCNGATASNTVNTCNGEDCVDFLESGGQSGRVLASHPALWTELELGFQTWGESADVVTTYFWGRSAADIAFAAMRWFARGGSHVNYYMLLGGVNFGWGYDGGAGAGVATSYATDAIICPDVLPHTPKFDHLMALHAVLSSVAGTILNDPRGAALNRSTSVVCLDSDARWHSNCTDALAFTYDANGKAVAFLESAADRAVKMRLARWPSSVNVTLSPNSAVLVDAKLGSVLFRSDDTPSPRLRRNISAVHDRPLHWRSWQEPTKQPGVHSPRSILASRPLEQTHITAGSTEFMWYDLTQNLTLPQMTSGRTRKLALQFAGAKSNAYSVWINGKLAGASENHDHWFDPPASSAPSIVTIPLAEASFSHADSNSGTFSLRILSENQAFDNSVSPGSGAKLKGLVGEVHLVATEEQLLPPGSYSIRSQGKRWRAADGYGEDQLVTTRRAPNGTEDAFTIFRFAPVDGAAFGTEMYYRIAVAGDDMHLQCDDAPAGDKHLSTRYQTVDDYSAFAVESLGNHSFRLRVKATNNVLWTAAGKNGGSVSTKQAKSCPRCDIVEIAAVNFGTATTATAEPDVRNLTTPAGGWRMSPFLRGEELQLGAANASNFPYWSDGAVANTALTWLTTNFSLTAAEIRALAAGTNVPGLGAQRVAVDTMGLGRGLAYINGHRLGRYFLAGAPPHDSPTQRYIPVPSGWLVSGSNVLTVLEAAGAPAPSSVRIVRSLLVAAPKSHHSGVVSDGCLDNAAFGR